MDRTYRIARRSIDGALVALVAVVGLVAAISLLAPLAGLHPFLIRGASMEPGVPRGALVLVTDGPDRAIAAGDIVSFREANGTIVTHRVADIHGTGDEALVTTKGDANTGVDPAAIPAGHVIGRVALVLPVLGFVSAMLTMPSGIASIVLLALALVILSWLVAELAPGPCAACAADRRRTAVSGSGTDEATAGA